MLHVIDSEIRGRTRSMGCENVEITLARCRA